MGITLLTDDCVISRNTKTLDSMGSWTDTWSTVATVKSALIGPQAGQLQTIDERIGVIAIWTVLLPFGQAVAEGNRLAISGHTLTVQAVKSPTTYSVVTACTATEVK